MTRVDRRQDKGDATLSGSVRRIVFRNPANDFCVVQLDVPGRASPVSVVGRMPELDTGMMVSAKGKWSEHPRFGTQLTAESVVPEPPRTLDGLVSFLGSKAVEGIGKVHAGRLAERFGDELFDILEKSPHRVREVEGIGPGRAKKIAEGWESNKVTRDTMVYLHGLGLGPAMAATIQRVYGRDAVGIVSRNPFQLIKDVRGIGFRTADALAKRSGIGKDSPERVMAGIWHLMDEARSNGNCGVRLHELVEQAEILLEVQDGLIRTGIVTMTRRRELVASNVEGAECVFLPDLHFAEAQIAARIRLIARGECPWGRIDERRAIGRIEAEDRMRFGSSQLNAIRAAVSSKFTVITGGPGVGKTTIVNAILKILATRKIAIRICAPTGRAAKRVSELTGRPAQTIHRLLEIDAETGGFRHDENNPIDCGLLIVDESSMIDVLLMDSLLRAVPDDAAIIMVGDVDQLPSVGPGRVLADVMESGDIEVVHLTEIYRQAAESRVVANAHRINAGEMPDLSRPAGASDFYFVSTEGPEEAVGQLLRLVSERIPRKFGFDPVRDVQVLCPMIRGTIGVQSLNARLKDTLNPGSSDVLDTGSASYSPGDKVMQIHNDYNKGIFNGDIGFVSSILHDEESLVVDFDGRRLEIGPNELGGLMPAYAVTIHKSQGSEFPAVVVPLMTQHFVMLQRNLLYTAVTRARELLILIGQRKAVEIAVRTDNQRKRMTRLGGLLTGVGLS